MTLEAHPERVEKLFNRVNRSVEARMDQTASEVSHVFMRHVRGEQPIGQLDPLREKITLRRPARPSVRLRNSPIEKGWVGPTISTPRAGERLITLKSRSPHVVYFTRWTGRPWLGTRAGEPQVAKRTPFLFFWWRGKIRGPLSTRGHGFGVERDFLQTAYESTKSEVKDLIRGLARLSVEGRGG